MTAATPTIAKVPDQCATITMCEQRANGVNYDQPFKVDMSKQAPPVLWSCWYIPAYRAHASGAG
jgi:hypothetical protein